MRVLEVDPEKPADEAIMAAADVLRNGGLVAFPTETVYGLGGNAFDPDAIERIYALKARPAYNPLIVHCRDTDSARALSREWPQTAARLAAAFWPGPLTLVVRKTPAVPAAVTAGLDTVALRVPSHPVAQALLSHCEFPLAAPSANRFTRVSPTRGEHVSRGLGGAADLLLDGGPSSVGIESTVIDVTGDAPTILRPGSLDPARLERAMGVALARPPSFDPTAPRPGPGMVERHYSPRATLRLIPAGETATADSLLSSARESGERTAILLRVGPAPDAADLIVRMPADPAGYARELYATLHRLDDERIDLALVEAPPEERVWAGVRDRLQRASALPSPPGVPFDDEER